MAYAIRSALMLLSYIRLLQIPWNSEAGRSHSRYGGDSSGAASASVGPLLCSLKTCTSSCTCGSADSVIPNACSPGASELAYVSLC